VIDLAGVSADLIVEIGAAAGGADLSGLSCIMVILLNC
jgi:hypothetical protein